jgi:Zn-dependent protease
VIDPIDLIVRMPVVLLALTLHEFAHAYTAYRLGDPTAARAGRCTLNPLAHLDLIGTLCIMFAPIGWAKPVPVNPYNLRHPSRDEMIVSAAGPISNVLQAIAWGLLIRLIFRAGLLDGVLPGDWGPSLFRMLCLGLIVNCGLAAFNMIPAFPLDGFHVTRYFLSPEGKQGLDDTAQYGRYIILALVLLPYLTSFQFDPLRTIIRYPVHLVWALVVGLPMAFCPI